MRELVTEGDGDGGDGVGAYVFHMSWTKNKDDKPWFLSRMGERYVKNACPAADIGAGEEKSLGPSTVAISCTLDNWAPPSPSCMLEGSEIYRASCTLDGPLDRIV
jgi:hypothetical protein